MNVEQIRELACILNEMDIGMIEINEGDNHIRLEREQQKIMYNTPKGTQGNGEFQNNIPVVDSNLSDEILGIKEIKSPMVGLFYTAPSPEQKSFVSIGEKVKKGQVICIIEAMKLFNEITAEEDGEIVEICANKGEIVEFGQTIFRYK